jgi:hypothetical protein
MARSLAIAASMPALVVGCASSRHDNRAAVDVLRDRTLSVPQRVDAIERALSDAGGDPVGVRGVAAQMQAVAWSRGEPAPLRIEAMRRVRTIEDEAVDAESRSALERLIPTEPPGPVLAEMCAWAGSRGWRELAPALVRSRARAWRVEGKGELTGERPDHAALAWVLAPESVADGAWGMVLSPEEAIGAKIDGKEAKGAVEPGLAIEASRVQQDAWQLLAELDPSGEDRRERVRGAIEPQSPRGRAALAALRVGGDELGLLPENGAELAWLMAVAGKDGVNKARAAWWQQVCGAWGDAGKPARLAMRHLEALRLSRAHASGRLSASRETLLEELSSRVALRTTVRRSWRGGQPLYREDVAASRERLSWGDLLVVLAIDDALQRAGMGETLWQQAGIDRGDGRTEYGGLWMERDLGEGPVVIPVLYPPRERERQGDLQFVAPQDLIEQGVTALGHYHFHAQEVRNEELAGPSQGDLVYADLWRHNCVVLTTVGEGRINADVLFPGGVVVDLGTVDRRPAGAGLGQQGTSRK